MYSIEVANDCLGNKFVRIVFEGDLFVMELHDIAGHMANADGENVHVYESPRASIDGERYETLQTNMNVESPTIDVSKSKCGLHISAFRNLQILWVVLLTIIVITSSVTIGVLLYKIVSLI